MKKRFFGILLCILTASIIGIGGSALSASAYDTTIEEWGIEYFNQLDVGIYWYTDDSGNIPVADYTVDKEKPTIIYTHGWKPSGESAVREGFSVKTKTESTLGEYEYEKEFYKYYLARGYNVGVFYWNQLADNEGTSGAMGMPDFGVDQKIWFSKNAENKSVMTYITYDDESATSSTKTSADDPTNPTTSIVVMYGQAIINALGTDYSSSLHLAGHSMGGQLTLGVSEYLCVLSDEGEISEDLLPDRVTLLDPYLEGFVGFNGPVTLDHNGKTYTAPEGGLVYTAYFAADAAETVRNHGIPIEGYIANGGMVVQNYATTLMPLKNGVEEVYKVHEKLLSNIVWVNTGLSSYGGFDPTHVMSVDYYFASNEMEVVTSEEGLRVPCASMPTEELNDYIGLTFNQIKEKGVEAFYYDRASFNVIDYATLATFTDDQAVGSIHGTVKVNERKGKPVTAELINADGDLVAESVVDTKGHYYFNLTDIDENGLSQRIAQGEYTIVIKADGVEATTIENVTVENSVVPVTVDEVEITMGGDNFLMYVVIIIVGVVIIVGIVGFVLAINNARKRKIRE